MWSEFVCGISLIINKIICNFTERLTKIPFAPIFVANGKGNPTKMVIFNLGYHPIDILDVWGCDFISKCVIGWFDWSENGMHCENWWSKSNHHLFSINTIAPANSHKAFTRYSLSWPKSSTSIFCTLVHFRIQLKHKFHLDMPHQDKINTIKCKMQTEHWFL